MENWPDGRLASALFFGPDPILRSPSPVLFKSDGDQVISVQFVDSRNNPLVLPVVSQTKITLDFDNGKGQDKGTFFKGTLAQSQPFTGQPLVYSGFVERYSLPNQDSEDIECTGGTGGGTNGGGSNGGGGNGGGNRNWSLAAQRIDGGSVAKQIEWPASNVSTTSFPDASVQILAPEFRMSFETPDLPKEVNLTDADNNPFQLPVTQDWGVLLDFEGEHLNLTIAGQCWQAQADTESIYFGSSAAVDEKGMLVVQGLGGIR